jgi:hypothetical protein
MIRFESLRQSAQAAMDSIDAAQVGKTVNAPFANGELEVRVYAGGASARRYVTLVFIGRDGRAWADVLAPVSDSGRWEDVIKAVVEREASDAFGRGSTNTVSR